MRGQLAPHRRQDEGPEHVERAGDAARDHDRLRVEQRHRARQRHAELAGRPLQCGAGRLVAGARGGDQLGAVCHAEPLCDAVERAAGGDALQPAAAILAGVVHVGARPPERAGAAARTGNDAAVGEHRRAYAGADRQQDRVRHALGRPRAGFGQQRDLGVVADGDDVAGNSGCRSSPSR